ncbi:hypothetical protein Hanom_Chr14g01290551 [Helianthus anomalus]
MKVASSWFALFWWRNRPLIDDDHFELDVFETNKAMSKSSSKSLLL